MEKKKILIVDDEWSILELLRIKFSKRGFDVSVARDGKEFKRLAFEKQPDLVILDIWLGNQGGGPQIYDDIIRAGFNPEVPVIFISALVEEGQPPKHAPEGGRFALYGKPFDFEVLLTDVRRLTGVTSTAGKKKETIDEFKNDEGGSYENDPKSFNRTFYGNSRN